MFTLPETNIYFSPEKRLVEKEMPNLNTTIVGLFWKPPIFQYGNKNATGYSTLKNPKISQYANCWDPNIPTVYLVFGCFLYPKLKPVSRCWKDSADLIGALEVALEQVWGRIHTVGGWRKKVWRTWRWNIIQHLWIFFRFFNMIFVKNPSESWIFLLKKTVSDDLVCSQSIRILEKSSKAAYLVMIFAGRLFTWQCIISIRCLGEHVWQLLR